MAVSAFFALAVIFGTAAALPPSDTTKNGFCKLKKDPSVNYNCIFEDTSRECKETEPDGTVVRPVCNAPYYRSSGFLPNMHCMGGLWDYVAKCVAECGLATSNDLREEGKPLGKGEMPWHAAFYTKSNIDDPYRYVCSGSLVTSNIVISAAHCFNMPLSSYTVAFGKTHLEWALDEDYQAVPIEAIYKPPRYLGAANLYQDDIAIVKLSKEVLFTPSVRPVCVNFDQAFESHHLKEGQIGKVLTIGETRSKPSSDQTWKTAEVPFAPIADCLKSADAFAPFITADKFCGGFRNGTVRLCKGDGGAGLVFPEVLNGVERFYLRGVASTAPKSNSGACSDEWFTTFTQISKHKDFIKQYL